MSELVFYANSSLLEGPVWNEKLHVLMCVSIEQECIYLINPESQLIQSYKTKGQVGFATFRDNEHIIYASYTGVYCLNTKTCEENFLFHLIKNKDIRYNDGKIDPYGRLLLGTTGYNCVRNGENALYSWDGKQVKTLIKNTTISNGLDWYGEFLFFIDTPTHKVGRYFYDNMGNVTFDRYIIEINKGEPDGMCIDQEDGTIYIAIWGGGRVDAYNQQGIKLCEYSIPVLNVSSVCIANDNLYVTTAKNNANKNSEMFAGGLFVIKNFKNKL